MAEYKFAKTKEDFDRVFLKEYSASTLEKAAPITFALLDDLESFFYSPQETGAMKASFSKSELEKVLLPAGTFVMVFGRAPIDFCNSYTCGFVVDEKSETVRLVSLFGSAQFDAWRRLRCVTPDRDWKKDRASELNIICAAGGFSVSLVSRSEVKVTVEVPLFNRDFVNKVNSGEPVTWFFDEIKKELEEF